ncbi:hemin uptake protein HemP [Roseinatronobacter monicus]|uniref:Hemin uptake protein HemP n=2 Tax=Roseinatronobacter monicus TaxID=393481 RepID=A0A543K9B3_9RHOB|nr:hemin uptake protein HemP [Roseinatronobacter monicus]
MTDERPENMQVPSPNRPCPTESIPVHSAEGLTEGGATAHIRLDGQVYTLRITRTNKLILTK